MATLQKALLLVSLLAISLSANAALIDNGSYTTDDVSGLDWLDLSETDAQIYNEAETLNPGWRYATNTEVEGLFAQAFVGYYNTNANGNSRSDENPYGNQLADIFTFQSLFGITFSPSSGVSASYGLYEDEDGIIRMMGAYRSPNLNVAYSDEFTTVYPRTSTYGNEGIYMVRAVPLPAAGYLFIAALAGLGLIKRKKS